MKIKKIVILFILMLLIFNQDLYAKYSYHFEEIIAEFTRNSEIPNCSVTYSNEEWTNQSVVITITSDKPIEQISGFDISEDKKNLTKEVFANENKIIYVRDFSGNSIELEYNVSNIDKELPEIIGCENGGTYSKPLNLDFSDNVDIESVFIDKYSDKLHLSTEKEYNASHLTAKVTEHPLNTKKYRYYINELLYATTAEDIYTFTGLLPDTSYRVKVQALDSQGNILDEKIISTETREVSKTVIPKSNSDDNLEEKNPYEITESGNYQIKVNDVSGNEKIYYIKVK